MKNHGCRVPLQWRAGALCAALFLTGCDGDGGGNGILLPAAPSGAGYSLSLPAIPPAWTALLGTPAWRIEWLNPTGGKELMTVRNGEKPRIAVPETWTGPVTAWPHWPARGIEPGVFKPAGALCPFDVSGGSLTLSWRGGVDTVLYWELAAAADPAASRAEASRAAVPRLPWNFNWPRFRDLFNEGSGLNADILADPWLADWSSIAAKTVKSGFDRRRLVPEARGTLPVPVGPGPWIGVSPFAEPLLFEAPPVFPVRDEPDTWVSAGGLLRCNREAWLFVPWE